MDCKGTVFWILMSCGASIQVSDFTSTDIVEPIENLHLHPTWKLHDEIRRELNSIRQSENERGIKKILKWKTRQNPLKNENQFNKVLFTSQNILKQLLKINKDVKLIKKLLEKIKEELLYLRKFLRGNSEELGQIIKDDDDDDDDINIYNSQEKMDVLVMNELSNKRIFESKMEKVLRKICESFKKNEKPSPVSHEFLVESSEFDVLKELEKNFSKIFRYENVTLKHINQMSKIIDFVEKYHGTANGFQPEFQNNLKIKSSQEGEGEKEEEEEEEEGKGVGILFARNNEENEKKKNGKLCDFRSLEFFQLN